MDVMNPIKSMTTYCDAPQCSEPTYEERLTYEQWRERLYNMSQGKLNENDGYDCAMCNNKGSIAYLKGLELYKKPCECMKTREILKGIDDSGLKELIATCTFKTFNANEPWREKLKDEAWRYVDNSDGKWFFIGGRSGGGKTHICTAICYEFLKSKRQVKYMRFVEEATELKGAITDIGEYRRLINPIKKAEVLYIDDLFKTGSEGEHQVMPTPADVRLAYEIIDYRASRNLKTVISSEFSLTEIININEALGGRIKKACGEFCFYIDKDKPNYRLEG